MFVSYVTRLEPHFVVKPRDGKKKNDLIGFKPSNDLAVVTKKTPCKFIHWQCSNLSS